MKALCEAMPLQLNQISVQTLTRPLQDFHLVSFSGGPAVLLQIASLAHNQGESFVISWMRL